MEDLTVNTQAAQFAANQQNQGLANTMSSLGSAAGGSGIAALAQSLANQQSQNAVQASASIGQQEASNQAAAAQQAGKIQSMEREGDLISRDLKRTQFTTEFGMANQDLRTANLAKQQATQSLVGGVGDAVTGGIAYKASLDASQGEEPGWAGILTGIGM